MTAPPPTPPPLSEGLDPPLDCDTQVKWKTRLGKIEGGGGWEEQTKCIMGNAKETNYTLAFQLKVLKSKKC